ncbi:GNAT family N-acetyltransferase [Mesorhizobium loti]|uniref:GNAT family N-acetyltransferase n=1 Tax=Rhizobium loti TaxID=381 RepID=UPI000D6ADD37|nr:GNAT family N-acetyltransferase [Mesorhizobium loti]
MASDDRGYLHEWETCGYGFWVVYERDDNGDLRFVGRSGLRRFDDKALEVGCILFGARCGQGIGPESSKPVIEFALATQPIDRLVSFIPPMNIRSLRARTRQGFTHFGSVVVDGTNYQFLEFRRPPQ